MGISKINREQGTADFGYWIGENYWKKGYVSEGIRKLIDYQRVWGSNMKEH